MLRRTLAIARAEWIHNKRDPRSLFVILALPVVLLLIYGYGINYDVQHVPFAVMDLDGGESARELLDQFRRSRFFSFREAITDQRRIQELMDASEVAFVLVIPPDLGRKLGADREAKVQIVLDGSDTTQANVAVGYIEAAVMDYSAKLAVDYARRQGVITPRPFEVRPVFLYNPDLKSVRFIVPGLIAVLLMMLAALLTSTCLVREREWGSFEALVTSPARSHEILIGKMIPYVCIAFADVILCIAAGRLMFGVYPNGSVAFLLAASALYLLASLSIGLLFSVMAKTQQIAILFAMLATLLPTILLSGFAFPRASMPVVLRVLSNVIPATHFLTVIRAIYLKAGGPGLLWPQIGVLAVFTVGLMALAAKRFRKRL